MKYRHHAVAVLLSFGLLVGVAQARSDQALDHHYIRVELGTTGAQPASGRLLLFAVDAKVAEAAAKAKAASLKVKAATADADKRYKEAQREAKESGDALAAALRTGDKRLRDLWACRAPQPGAGGAAADGAEAGAARRADSAGRIDRAVKADAAAIDYLWDRWQADRQAVVASGCAVEVQ